MRVAQRINRALERSHSAAKEENMKNRKLTTAERRALSSVASAAIQNMCCCGNEEFVDGKGYLGHDRACYVHLARKDLRIVRRLVGEQD